MKTLLFYDTETTGLPDFGAPSDAAHQPHITQIAALLTDEAGNKLASLDLLVRPDGWTIPEDLQALTGITMERAELGGVRERVALAAFEALWRRSSVRIAHNERFDARILRIGFKRFGGICDPDDWKAGPATCTQVLSTPILKLPPTERMIAAGRRHHKSANLREAYEFFTGKPLSGAHNAMIDVMGVKAVWFAIQARQAPPSTPPSETSLAEAV